MRRVYLDYASCAPVDARVRAVMEPWQSDAWNPSSLHTPGRQARAALDHARVRLARTWSLRPRELIFTASGSESVALAVLGRAALAPRGRFLMTPVEHAAVLGCAAILADRGWQIVTVPIDERGAPDLERLTPLLAEPAAGLTILSCMLVNNELGTISNLAAIVELAHAHGAYVHCDAIAIGDAADVAPAFAADAVSLAAQKCGGPVGAGILWLRDGIALAPLIPGGPQEAGRRAGTENTPAIVGAVEAFCLRESEREERARTTKALQRIFEDRLRAGLSPAEFRISVDHGPRVSTITHLLFHGLDGAALLAATDLAGLDVSAGSACAAGALERSHVVRALAVEPEWTGVLRCSWGAATSRADIIAAGDILLRVVRHMHEVRRAER